MTDQELKDLVASLAISNRETDQILKEISLSHREMDQILKETSLSHREMDQILKETDLIVKETSLSQKETDRKMQETDRIVKENALQMKETDRKWAESCEKWDKLSKKLEKMNGFMSGMSDNIGHHAEQFFQNAFSENLTFAGIKYDKMYLNVECKSKTPGGEFDIMLVNGKNVAIIEVKNRIHPDFVKVLAEKKAVKFRKFFPEYVNCKLYLGVAGFSFSNTVVEEAKVYGVGVIRQVGKSIEVDTKDMKAY